MAKDSRQDTVSILQDCYSTCLEAFSLHCARQGGGHMEQEHMRLMLSSIDLCALTADFLLRRSPLAEELCDLCAQVCRQCAISCEGLNDARMDACADVCDAAASACLEESYYLKTMAA